MAIEQIEVRQSRRWNTTRHAVTRWIDRVNPAADLVQARAELRAFLDGGTVRARPRHWTKVGRSIGSLFVYNAAHPRVCVVIRNATTLTVLTRDLPDDDQVIHPMPVWRYH